MALTGLRGSVFSTSERQQTNASSSKSIPGSTASGASTAADLPKIVIGDDVLTMNEGADASAFVSINPATNELWITLNTTLTEATIVRIVPDSKKKDMFYTEANRPNPGEAPCK